MADILNLLNPLSLMLIDDGVNELLKTNEEICNYGLVLSAKDAKEIVEYRNEVLQSYGRIELSMEVLEKITLAVSSSPFISRSDFATTIHEFVELFYYAKNETMDKISDGKLIDLMKEYFDSSCYGSIELLQSRELESLIRAVLFDLPIPIRFRSDRNDEYAGSDGNDGRYETQSEEY